MCCGHVPYVQFIFVKARTHMGVSQVRFPMEVMNAKQSVMWLCPPVCVCVLDLQPDRLMHY